MISLCDREPSRPFGLKNSEETNKEKKKIYIYIYMYIELEMKDQTLGM